MKKLVISAVVALSLVAGVASAQSYYPTYTSGTTYSSGACLSISTGLTVGSRGSKVLALQQFLVSQGYPGSGTWMETSYFGTATRAALIDFQQSQGLPQTGIVDVNTLSALQQVSCGGSSYAYPGYPGYTGSTYPYGTTYPSNYYGNGYPYNYNGYGTPTITSLSQNTGVPGNTVTIYGQGFEPQNTVYFGGEAISGISSGSTSLTFTIPYISSSYSQNQTEQIYVTNSDGTSNSVSFTLNPSTCGNYGCSTCGTYSYGSNTNCNCSGYSTGYNYGTCGCSNTYAYTSNCSNCGYVYSSYPYSYNPGCPNGSGNTNSPTITYLNPQSGGVGTDVTVYGSGFTTSNNTIHFGTGIVTGLGSPDGQSVSFVVPSQLTGYGSQPVVLGSYQVSVTNSNNVTSNAVPFTVTSTASGNGAPVISSVSGPTNVTTGTSYTWQVTVSNPNSTYATVSVAWGDTGNGYVNQAAPQTISGGTQTVTFSHAYETSGTYTLTFTVGNQNGQSNTYTETIVASGSGVNGSIPTITYITPTSGYVGTQVTIYGSNFSTSGNNVIFFGNGAIQNVYSNGNYITFTVPSAVGPYCAQGVACPQYVQQVTPGSYEISVMDQYGTSNQVPFTVL